MGFQLIAGLVMAGLLTAGFLSWKSDIRAEGEANLRKEYEAQQLAEAKENERIAAEGKAAVLRLLAEKEQQNRAQAAQLANLQARRQGESDARAKADSEYALWRESAAPRYVAERVQFRIQSAAAAASRGGVPGGTGLSSGQVAPEPAAVAPNESWIRSLYRRINGSSGNDVAGSGPNSK